MSDAIMVEIWSDVACPWCYIGKRKFERGLEAFQAEGDAPEVTVEYRSFELSPDTPVDFEGSTTDFLSRRKGIPVAQVEQMLERVTGIAASVGLDYDFDAVKHTNTIKAHQVIHYAKARGRQAEMKERLLKAYFEDGRNVGYAEELADLSAEIGLDRADVLRSLAEDEYLPAVEADKAQAIEYGIQGVPFFVIDGKYGISGAQEAANFTAALRQVREEHAAAGASR